MSASVFCLSASVAALARAVKTSACLDWSVHLHQLVESDVGALHAVTGKKTCLVATWFVYIPWLVVDILYRIRESSLPMTKASIRF